MSALWSSLNLTPRMNKPVCVSAAATLASMAGNETVAGYIMNSPGDSVAKTVMTLLEVRDPLQSPHTPALTAFGHTHQVWRVIADWHCFSSPSTLGFF